MAISNLLDLRVILSLFILFLSIPLKAANSAEQSSCASLLTKFIDNAISSAASSEPDSTRSEHLQAALTKLKSTIENKVKAVCPDFETCPTSTLTHVINAIVDEEISKLDTPQSKIGWRVWMTVSASVLTYMGLSTAAQTYLGPITATMTVAFLTYFGTVALDAVGAPILETVLSPIRRWNYSKNKMAEEKGIQRNETQDRLQDTYLLQQELLSNTEQLARTTHYEVISQIQEAIHNCLGMAKLPGFRHIASHLLAKLLKELNTTYPDINLRSAKYTEWVRIYFTVLLPTGSEESFIQETLTHLEKYDLSLRANNRKRFQYLTILKAWLAPISIPELGQSWINGDGI